jgi:predicted transcriptional regulator
MIDNPNGRNTVRVKDVMKREFDLIDGLTTVSEALRTMKHKNNKSLIIDKRHKGDEYGFLLLSDVARHVLAKDHAPDRVSVYEIMAKPVITVKPDMDIRYCARLFERFNLSRAPVIENDEIVGIISFTDMVLKGLYADIINGG